MTLASMLLEAGLGDIGLGLLAFVGVLLLFSLND